MKKILYILLLVGWSAWSQTNTATSEYVLVVNGVILGGCCGTVGGLREVSLNLTNGGTIYKLRESDPSFIEESHWYFEHRFSLAGRVYSVKVRTKNGSNDGPWDERTVWINPQTCANTAIVGPFGKNETRFEVIVYPEILLADNQDYFSDVNQPFRISLSNQISISQINWQYTTTPHIAGSWQDLPAIYKSQTNLSIYGDEFLSWEDHGKEVYFRNDSGCETNYNRFISKYGATTPVNHSRYSNLISALYLKPAPKITSAIPSDLPCYDSASGSAKITFERALNPSEQISFSLRNTTLNLDYSEENITLSTADNSFMATGLLPGDYELELLGFDQGYNTYTEGAGYSATFSIEKPTAIDYSVNPTDAFCHGGSDGSFRIFAEGGAIQKSGLTYYEFRMEHLNPPTGNDLSKGWTSFTGLSAHSVTGLPAGQYKIWVRDTNGCVAKEVVRSPPDTGPIIGVGIEEHTETITIGQPSAPLAVTYTLLNEPSGHGLSDGSIRAHITGGTPFGNGSYSYTWRYENGVTLNGIGTTVPGNPGWFLTLNNAKAGKYYLTITDAKHATASNKEGCTLVNSEFVLTQPPPLAVNLQQTGLISCNTGNSVGDPTNNGQLTAAGSGGVPLDSFTNGTESYWYVWKKRVGQGTFQTIHGEQASVLSNIGPGTYSVNIVDKNGITIGTYVNNVLVNTTDTTITVIEPPLLELSLTKQDVFCYQGSDGSIQAIISGGTAPISLQWDHGPVTNSLNGLSEGNYSAIATDARGCSVRASIQITAPQEALEVVYTFRPPSFSGATDGRITALISGGTPRMDGSYIYHWRDPDLISMNPEVVSRILPEGFELVLDNVGAGTYLLTVEDGLHATAIQKTNCTIINSSFTLDEPDPLEVTVAMQNPISCNGANVYNDPAADGVLEAFALGGVPLQPSDNNGLPYYYTWKKEASPGVWTVLTAQTTHVASGLDAGNYAVNITDANGIIIGDYVDNVLSKAQNVEFVFNEPPLLEIALDKQDVFCHNGSDASAWVTITGGITPYTILWDNGGTTPQIDNLTEGTYEVTVIDARGCQAIASVEVGQPEYPLQVEHVAYAYPSTGGASDGWLRTQISGGTALEDGDYAYIWKDAHGNDLVGNTTTSIVDGKFEIYLQRLSKGSYFLVVEDANYTQAITKEGCTQILEAFVIEDPLEAVISVDVPISCSAGNPFDDPSSDGVLKVVVSGGVPFTTGQPYTYEWKKRASNGGLEDLGQDAPIAVGLSEGEYFFNVTDSKGRVIGTYDSDQLLAKTDVPFVFNGPEPIELTFSTTPISCSSGADGTAQVYIQGGVAPYEIEWSNGEENDSITGLISGIYAVYITDVRGCRAFGQVTVEQPGGLSIETIAQTNPTCFQGNDGSIEVAFSGGVTPYTYAWEHGPVQQRLEGLSAGNYTLKLTDAEGCTAFKTIPLEDPKEYVVELGDTRNLCQDQTVILDGRIDDPNATYLWISDIGDTYDTGLIEVAEAGNYQVVATSTEGCTATDDVDVQFFDEVIDAQFLMGTQAYKGEEVILFNVSDPMGEASEWIIPEDVENVAETETSVTLHFPAVGTYEIGLLSTQGDCEDVQYKQIVIEEGARIQDFGDDSDPFIESFVISPNPGSGNFGIAIRLAEEASISLRFFTINGEYMGSHPSLEANLEYELSQQVNWVPGIYFVVLETAKETQIKKLVII